MNVAEVLKGEELPAVTAIFPVRCPVSVPLAFMKNGFPVSNQNMFLIHELNL